VRVGKSLVLILLHIHIYFLRFSYFFCLHPFYSYLLLTMHKFFILISKSY
jgi:hypothetical protein